MKLSVHLFVILGLSVLFLTGCDRSSQKEQMVRELLELDREFSRQSAENGSNKAFLSYIDDSCVILRPNKIPIHGRKKIEEMFSKPDTSMTLRWVPLFGEVSESGELGYTYGIYTIDLDSPVGKAETKEGTYVTIWKKDPNGKWKFVLDTGNQGLGKKNEENN